MKVCPKCRSENEDQYIYCGNCHKPLPTLSKLEHLKSVGYHALEKRDWREAEKHFDQVVQMNIGDKEAWFMKGVALLHLRSSQEARQCFQSACVQIQGGRCERCAGTGKCADCGATGFCYMCKNRRKCNYCHGTGECGCGGSQSCSMCHGAGQCIRCKGTGECIYCHGTGTCESCDGNKVCSMCGGEGKSIKFVESSVPPEWKRHLMT
jgi:hypothetical protein